MTNDKNTTLTPAICNKKHQWPYIKYEERKGLWRVDARTRNGGARRYFKIRMEAIGWAEAQRVLRANEGEGAFDNSELAEFGMTIRDAIKFTLAHFRQEAASAPIEEMIKTLLETKMAAGRTSSYLWLVENNLGKVARHFAGRKIGTISADELNAFLAGLPIAPETWNTIRRDCVTLWEFAKKRGTVTENVANEIERAKRIEEPPGLLTPTEVSNLLLCSSDDLLAFHAIGAFAGPRTCEIEKLVWQDIDLAGGFITVPAKKAKTRARRLVPILPNLKAWLQLVARPSGPICGINFRRRREAAQESASIKVWPKNALRNSFISYRLAATQNTAQVALEAGNSPEIIFKNYRELVRPKEAERYFNILPAPAGSEKITPITEAA